MEVLDKGIVDPYVEVTLYVPDWPVVHHVGGVVGVDELQKGKGKETTTTSEQQQQQQRETPTTTTTIGGDGTEDDQVNEVDYYYVSDADMIPPSSS